MLVSIITNPHSRINRSGRNSRLLSELDWYAPQMGSVAELDSAISDVLGRGTDLLVINGGDGTVQVVLTALLARPGSAKLPLLALLPGGTTNMSANDINGTSAGFKRTLQNLRTFVASDPSDPGSSPAIRPRAMLRIDDGAQARCGFFLGVGSVVDGIEYCHEQIYALGITGALAPGLAVLRAAYGIARNEPRFSQPCQLTLTQPDGEAQPLATSMFLSSTLEHLFLGIRPFWGQEPYPLRYTLIRARPHRFFASLPQLVRGNPQAKLTPAQGYHSHNVPNLRLQGEGRFTIDGEFYSLPSQPLEISLTEPLPFLALGNLGSTQ